MPVVTLVSAAATDSHYSSSLGHIGHVAATAADLSLLLGCYTHAGCYDVHSAA